MPLTPEERAAKSAEAMWTNDDASKWMGMKVITVGVGSATITMQVQKHHTNGHDTCHGGIISTLADSAFAFACNSYNQATVAQHFSISFIAPAMLNDTLTARAVEVSKSGRSGIYDVKITRDDGTVIAEFRGNARTIKGTHFEEVT